MEKNWERFAKVFGRRQAIDDGPVYLSEFQLFFFFPFSGCKISQKLNVPLFWKKICQISEKKKKKTCDHILIQILI